MTPIETDRLLLRDFRPDDWESVHRYASDPEVTRYMLWGPNTPEETRSFIRRAIAEQGERPRRHYELAVVLKGQGPLIGSCGIDVSAPERRQGWIGYALARHHWGQGYATEAARGVVTFGFGELGLHRIFGTCDPANRASARVMEKLGMRREGLLKEYSWGKDAWHDRELYAVLDYEWHA